jgi:hypothetical protein
MRRRLFAPLALTGALLALGACGKAADAPGGEGASGSPPSASSSSGGAEAGGGAGPALAGRTETFVSPTDDQMIALFYTVSGVTPPINDWVESDVQYSNNIDKSGEREASRVKFNTLLDSTRNIGALQVVFNGNLSDYDPQYHEFIIDGLGASSYLSFSGFNGRERVRLRFKNGRKANVWAVPPEEVQAISDKLRSGRTVQITATLSITGATPTPGDYAGKGVIDANVVEYDIVAGGTGLKIGHVVVSE